MGLIANMALMTFGQAAHADYCVDILKACWLHPAFAESHRLLRVDQAKELVIVLV